MFTINPNDIIKFEDKGFLRDKHLGYIEISPFEYNPKSNIIKVINNDSLLRGGGFNQHDNQLLYCD